jgi:hypothetical protein
MTLLAAHSLAAILSAYNFLFLSFSAAIFLAYSSISFIFNSAASAAILL